MPATATFVTRQKDTTGEKIAAFTKDDGSIAQSFVLDAEVMGEILTTAATGSTALAQDLAASVAGRLFRAEVVLKTPPPAGNLWLLLVDRTDASVANDVPFLRSPKMSGDFASIDLGVYGVEFAAGCQLVVSSTPDKVTLVAGAGFFQWAVS